jgi:chromosome segregation ATPase
MAASRLQVEKPPLQLRQRSVCSFCHNTLDPNARFCDTCGTPHEISEIYQVRSQMQQNVDTLNATLQSLESRRAGIMKEIEVLEGKKRMLAEDMRPLTIEVESLRSKQGELTTQLETLTTQLRESEERIKSKEASLVVLRRERLELESQVKPIVRNNGRPHKMPRKKKPRDVKQETHTFIGTYDGKEDWNTELAKRISQLGLTLDHTTYSVSPEKIVFSVTGSTENIEKLATSLSGLEGFVNLRSKLAETKRNLRETLSAKNIRQEELDALNKTPWYKREKPRGLATQKAELSQQISADDLRLKALNESLKALENLLGDNEPKASVSS